MTYSIESPLETRIDNVVRLCRDHAAYEQSDYSEDGKAELLVESIFSNSPKLFCKVAVVNGNYIGYVTWMRQYSSWDASEYLYMDCLYIDDAYRSMGIGAKLVEEIKKYGRNHQIDLIQWQTPDFNKRAIKFYKRIGATSKSKERFFLSIS